MVFLYWFSIIIVIFLYAFYLYKARNSIIYGFIIAANTFILGYLINAILNISDIQYYNDYCVLNQSSLNCIFISTIIEEFGRIFVILIFLYFIKNREISLAISAGAFFALMEIINNEHEYIFMQIKTIYYIIFKGYNTVNFYPDISVKFLSFMCTNIFLLNFHYLLSAITILNIKHKKYNYIYIPIVIHLIYNLFVYSFYNNVEKPVIYIVLIIPPIMVLFIISIILYKLYNYNPYSFLNILKFKEKVDDK